MSLFQQILSQLTDRISYSERDKQVIVDIITKTVGVSLSVDSITVRKHTLYVHVSPTIKTALLMKKGILLSLLKQHSIFSIE